MQTRRIVALLISCVLALSFLIFVTPAVHAAPDTKHVPLVTCNECYADGDYTASQFGFPYIHGGYSDVYANTGGATLFNGNSWTRELFASPYNGGDAVIVGFDINNICAGSSTESVFWRVSTASGNVLITRCTPLAGLQLTDIIRIGVSYYVSNGGGTFIWITDTNDVNRSVCNPCSYASGTAGEAWQSLEWTESTLGTFTGTRIPRDHWKFNRVVNPSGTTIYVNQQFAFGPTCCSNTGTGPVQFYWSSVPTPFNSGGDLISCVIATGNTC